MEIRQFSPRRVIAFIKANKKELFWLWVAYQSIKGVMTLTLIWIPLWVLWRSNN